MTEKKEDAMSRRSFFGAAGKGVAVGAGAVVAAVSSAGAAEVEVQEGSGYRETDHVKTYYNSARF